MGTFIDLTGQTFGEWEVLSYVGSSKWLCKSNITGEEKEYSGYHLKNGRVTSNARKQSLYLKLHDKYNEWEIIEIIDIQHYKCRCSCGKSERIILKTDLVTGRAKSCGHDSPKAFKDLTGMTFGDWKVLEYLGNRMWKCECQCKLHTIRNVHGYSLISGRSTSCGHPKQENIDVEAIKEGNYRGAKFGIKLHQKFGEWEVIGDVTDKYKVLCRCSCGKTREINIYTLRDGKSTSCGHTMNQDRIKDLTNRTFGELTPIRYLGDSIWECRCSCGKIVNKSRTHLLDGRAISCGHGTNKEPVDLTNKTFGKLHVLQYVGNKRWLCKCDCGNTKVIRSANLVNNSTTSCGCVLYTPTKEELITKLEEYANKHNRKPSITDMADYVGVSYKSMLYHLSKYELNNSDYIDTIYASQGEREIYRFIVDNYTGEVKHNIKSVIPPYELDIYIPDKKLAIEYNGVYWHQEKLKGSTYHQDKVIECKKQGITLINIFEYEWVDESCREKLKELLLLKINDNYGKIEYGRNLELAEIENSEAVEFCNRYHINNGVSANINIALKDKDTQEILGVMTFSKPRFNSEVEYELIRMAFKSGIKIVGGAERMFKYFIDKYKPQSIISYCDLSKFSGISYLRLGFKCDKITKPSYVWVSNHCDDVVSRYESMKKDLVSKGLGTLDETESEIMERRGYMKICNCGNLRFVWRAE